MKLSKKDWNKYSLKIRNSLRRKEFSSHKKFGTWFSIDVSEDQMGWAETFHYFIQ